MKRRRGPDDSELTRGPRAAGVAGTGSGALAGIVLRGAWYGSRVFGINGGEMIVLVLLALFLIGPERLPEYAEKLKELVKAAKRYATGTTNGLKETLGPEFADVDWRKLDPRQYDPRTIVRQALLEDDDAPAASSATTPDRRDELVSARLAPGERAPFDGEST